MTNERLSVLILSFALTAGSAFGSAAAQEHPPATQATPEQGEVPAHAGGPPAGDGHGTAKSDGHEGGGNSLHEQERRMKQSAAVQALGKMLGVNDPGTAYWIFVIINFLIIAIAIGAFLRKKLPTAFQGRTSLIQKGIEEARKASAESSARLSDIEARLSRLDSEISNMRTETERSAQAEEQRLRAAAEEEKRKIVESAEQEVEAAATAARRELKLYAANLAIDLAEKRISVSESADRMLVRDFAENLSADGNGGR